MRRARFVTVTSLLLITALAGCLAGDDGASDDEAPGGTGSNGRSGGGSSGNGGVDGGTSETDGPAPPLEQRKNSTDEITRPGEYAMLSRTPGSTDARWEVPSWSAGDWWRWQIRPSGGACLAEYTEEVVGAGTEWDVDVYRTESSYYDQCGGGGNVYRESSMNRMQDHLSVLSDNGYVNHEILFTLEDGARWVFMNQHNSLVEAKTKHLPNHNFGLQVIEAWRITTEFEGRCVDGDCDEVVKHQWYGVEQAALLKEEIYVNGAATPTNVIELVDSSRGMGGVLPILGPLHG